MATACARNQYRNRYYHRARLSERKFRELLRCFAVDLNASDTARLSGISVRSVNTLFLKLRRRLAAHAEGCSVFNELPENAGCGILDLPLPQAGSRAAGRAPLLFGLHRHHNQVYTELVPESASPVLHELVRGRRELGDLFGPQDWVSRYHGLADLGRGRYLRLQWPGSESPPNVHALHGLEAFWRFARQRLQQFRGLHRHTFELHLKETEYRFNHPRDQLYPGLLAMLREQPL